MADIGAIDTALVTRESIAMVNVPEPEITFHTPPAANAGTNAGGTRPARINEGLKPKPLTQDAYPEEFRSWEKCFKAFYGLSILHNGPKEEQQAYLYMGQRKNQPRNANLPKRRQPRRKLLHQTPGKHISKEISTGHVQDNVYADYHGEQRRLIYYKGAHRPLASSSDYAGKQHTAAGHPCRRLILHQAQ